MVKNRFRCGATVEVIDEDKSTASPSSTPTKQLEFALIKKMVHNVDMESPGQIEKIEAIENVLHSKKNNRIQEGIVLEIILQKTFSLLGEMVEKTLRETESLYVGGIGPVWDNCDASVMAMTIPDYKIGTHTYGKRTLDSSYSMKLLKESTSSQKFKIKNAVKMFILLQSLLTTMTGKIEFAAPERERLVKRVQKEEEEKKKFLQENKELQTELSKEQTNREHILKLEAQIHELEDVILMLKKEGFKEGSKANKAENCLLNIYS